VKVKAHAKKVASSEEAAERLAVILETVGGELTVKEACEELGIKEAQFHRLREKALAGAASALEPGRRGRPKKEEVGPTSEEHEALKEELFDTKFRLRASQLRERISLLMPHLLVDQDEGDLESGEPGSLFPPKSRKS